MAVSHKLDIVGVAHVGRSGHILLGGIGELTLALLMEMAAEHRFKILLLLQPNRKLLVDLVRPLAGAGGHVRLAEITNRLDFLALGDSKLGGSNTFLKEWNVVGKDNWQALLEFLLDFRKCRC